jgi:hypothetical protein
MIPKLPNAMPGVFSLRREMQRKLVGLIKTQKTTTNNPPPPHYLLSKGVNLLLVWPPQCLWLSLL